VPAEVGWSLLRFEPELDAWAERENVPPDLLLPVLAWILDRMDDPYDGVQRAEGFDNLWHGSIPQTFGLVPGRVVTCSYWIEENTRTVRCDNFGLQ
jgi:hypothetical protein